MAEQLHHIILLLVVGGTVLLSLVTGAYLRRTVIPPLVGYILIGLLLSIADEWWSLLGQGGIELLGFFAEMGVFMLLFSVGMLVHLHRLMSYFRSASLIWVGNIIFSTLAGYAAARYLLALPLDASLLIAVAMSATSVGIPTQVWQDRKQLLSPNGQRFLIVSELDDISAIIMMVLLFSLLPLLDGAEEGSLGAEALSILAVTMGIFLLFVLFCGLFSLRVEPYLSRFLRRFEERPYWELSMISIGILIAAVSGLLGFSVAIGAFFAGMIFSRDRNAVEIRRSFKMLYAFFVPFFFIAIGMNIEVGAFSFAFYPFSALLAAAVVGKVIGTYFFAVAKTDRVGALILSLSMIPRAEMMLIILYMGEAIISEKIYLTMVMVSAATAITVPVLLNWALRRWPQQ